MAKVKKVAQLANIKLSEQELAEIEPQFEQILSYFDKLSEANTKGVEPLTTPTEVAGQMREDIVVEFDKLEEALEQAPDKMGQLYKVPPVVS